MRERERERDSISFFLIDVFLSVLVCSVSLLAYST